MIMMIMMMIIIMMIMMMIIIMMIMMITMMMIVMFRPEASQVRTHDDHDHDHDANMFAKNLRCYTDIVFSSSLRPTS